MLEGEGGEIRRLLLARKVSLSEDYIYLLSHFFSYGLFFFIFCVLAPRGMNKIGFWGMRGQGQESTACSEGISSRRENDILRQYNDKFAILPEAISK